MELSTPKQRLDCIRAADVLRPLEPGLLESIAERLESVALEDGEWLFQQGDSADALFVVHDGLLRVELRPDSGDPIEAEITPGQPVGEIQVLTGGRRTAGARAVGRCELVRVPALALRELLEKSPEAKERMAEIARRRLLYIHQRAVVGEFFGPLDEILLAGVEAEGEWMRLARGETLFRRGDPADALHLVISGRLQALGEAPGGGERLLGEIRRGESIGEMALLSGAPRAATVRAVRQSVLLRFPREAFERLLGEHPRLLRQLARILIRRLATPSAPAPPRATLALVPASAGFPLDAFAEHLATALAQHGPVRRVSAQRLDQALETPGAARAVRTDPQWLRGDVWLDECEARHRFVVYVCDPEPNAWSRRCAERADAVWLVARADDDPEPGALEQDLLAAPDVPTMDLVLAHSTKREQPSGTQAWLQERSVRWHHHVRPELASDMARLARFAAGTPIGLALGGGGPWGLVQVGALRALSEAGVEPDVVAGTGIGAHLAAGLALGWDAETALARAAEVARACTPKRWLGLGGGAGRTLEQCLDTHFGAARVEDLWVPLVAVAADLTRGELAPLSSGELRAVLYACLATPGVLEPARRNGSLLCNGGSGSGDAAWAARAAGAGPVIAVDAAPRLSEPEARGLEGPSLASLLALVRRSGGAETAVAGDLRLELPVEGHQTGALDAARTLVELGRQGSAGPLAAWLEARRRPAGHEEA